MHVDFPHQYFPLIPGCCTSVFTDNVIGKWNNPERARGADHRSLPACLLLPTQQRCPVPGQYFLFGDQKNQRHFLLTLVVFNFVKKNLYIKSGTNS